jgi:hypothetical protein
MWGSLLRRFVGQIKSIGRFKFFVFCDVDHRSFAWLVLMWTCAGHCPPIGTKKFTVTG